MTDIELTFDGNGMLAQARAGKRSLTVRRPPVGPALIERYSTDGPVSVFDVQAVQRGIAVPAGHRAIRGEGTPWGPDRIAPDAPIQVVAAEEVHRRLVERRGRGRTPDLPLDRARAIKRAYWRGDATGVDIATQFGVAVRTVYRIIHGESYWWA